MGLNYIVNRILKNENHMVETWVYSRVKKDEKVILCFTNYETANLVIPKIIKSKLIKITDKVEHETGHVVLTISKEVA